VIKRPVLYVVREGEAECNVIPFYTARLGHIAAPARAATSTWPRETSWRDRVRSLTKHPVKI